MIMRGVAVGQFIRRDPEATTAYVEHYMDCLEAGDSTEAMVQDVVEEAETMFED